MNTQNRNNHLATKQAKGSIISSSQGRTSTITEAHSGKHPSKIETDEKNTVHSQKHYLVDDQDYNSMIYQWRKSVTAPVARVFEMSRTQNYHPETQQSYTKCTIGFERFQIRLSDYDHFTKEETLLILRTFLDAHHAIFKKMGATSISLDKAGINSSGEIRVWINKELDRNEISGQLLTTEEKIIERIIDLIEVLAGKDLDSLKEYMTSIRKNPKNKNKKFTFSEVKGMLRSYIQCLRIKVPSNLKGKKIKLIKSTLLEEPKEQSPFVSRMTFSIRNRSKSSKDPRSKKKGFGAETINNFCSYSSSKNDFLSPKATSFKNYFESAMQSVNNKRSYTSSDISTSKKGEDTKRRKPSISINGNFIKDLDLQESIVVKNRNTVSTHFVTTPEIQLKRNRSNSFDRNMPGITTTDCIKQDLTPREEKNISQILIKNIGFTSLPEVYQEEESNSSINSSAQKPERLIEDVSTPHFNAKRSSYNSKRQSGISTTNNSSITHFLGFGKKCKESNVTINLDEKDEKDEIGRQIQCRSATQKERKNLFALGGTGSKKQHTYDSWNSPQTKIKGSNCQNLLTIHNILMEAVNETAAKIKQEKLSSIKSLNEASLETIVREKEQTNSRQGEEEPADKNITSIDFNRPTSVDQDVKNPTKDWNRRPFNYLTELIAQNEIESYENTEYSPTKGNTSKRSNVDDHLLELLKVNKKLVISTYMQSESEKKIKHPDTPPKTEHEKVKEIKEGLSDLIVAKLNSQKVISNYDWTKKLENLLDIKCTQVKESYIEGPETQTNLNIKLTLLDTHGRDIGVSQFPDTY